MRELDWKIHTLMGNDLTGCSWLDAQRNYVDRRDDAGKFIEGFSIPHYSTTWEGAGLVMEWLHNNCYSHTIERIEEGWACCVMGYSVAGPSVPQALTDAVIAYISAMEERQ